MFKFKFYLTSQSCFSLESLKSFFDSWKTRHPMLLQISGSNEFTDFVKNYVNLVEEYKAKGIVKKYDDGYYFEDLEWIKSK